MSATNRSTLADAGLTGTPWAMLPLSQFLHPPQASRLAADLTAAGLDF